MRIALGVVVSALVLPSCASSVGSSKSLGDSLAGSVEAILSPFESSSRSSGSGAEETAKNYRLDVEAYTVAYLDRNERSPSFLRGLGLVAQAHGITDWESAPETFDALAGVVHNDGLTQAQLQQLERELAPLGESTRNQVFPADPQQ